MGDVERLLSSQGPAFWQALLLTWKLTALSFVPGFALGVAVAALRLFPLPPLRAFLSFYVEVFRNIPSVALLIFIVFALPDLEVVIDYEHSVVLTLALVCSAFTADYLRTGINTIPAGQIEAALSLGMRPARIIYSIVLPQALRSVVQPLTSLLIALMLSTSLASQVPLPGRELTAPGLQDRHRLRRRHGRLRRGRRHVRGPGLLIAWAGAVLDKKVRILR